MENENTGSQSLLNNTPDYGMANHRLVALPLILEHMLEAPREMAATST